MDSIELEKVGAMMREVHERLCALVPEYWTMGVQSEQEAAEPLSAIELEALLWAVGQRPLEDLRVAGVKDRFGDGVDEGALVRATAKLQRALRGASPADRWAGFSDDEVRWLIAVLCEAAYRHPDLTDVAHALTEDVRSEYQRRTRPAGEKAKSEPSQKEAVTNYRAVTRDKAIGSWSPEDNVTSQCGADWGSEPAAVEWFSYNHTRAEFTYGVWGQSEKSTNAPERWSGWSDEELDMLDQWLGDGGHVLADLKAEVRRRHEADDGLSDAERRAVEVLAHGEWPDHPVHGTWRAGCMVAWLKAAGVVLVLREGE